MFENLLNEKSSWEILKETALPIAVYGTGNGADRVFNEFSHLGIKVAAVTASDTFVRKRTFRGFEVKSISETLKEHGEAVIVIAFASHLPQVTDNIKSLMKSHTVIMPSVPVYGNSIFNKDFFKSHLSEIESAYSLLADEKSKQVFENIIKFQLSGNLKFTFECETEKNEAFELLNLGEKENYLDLGAYRGDTIDEFLHYTGKYSSITALEPDEKTFKKLSLHCERLENVTLLNNAVWDDLKSISFQKGKGRGSSESDGNCEITSITVDSILNEAAPFSYIKADVEGAEINMLNGALHTVSKYKPKLNISAYHRSEDIFSLTNKIHKMNPDYKIYLRHHPHISFWDTNLYCI